MTGVPDDVMGLAASGGMMAKANKWYNDSDYWRGYKK